MNYLSILLSSEPPGEGLELLGPLVEAAQGGKWSLFVSLLIMILVWLATKAPLIRDWIKGEAKIWTAAVAGILGAFATSLFAESVGDDGVDWLKVIMEGLSVGLAAGGLWSLVGRKLAGQPVDADGDGKLDPLPPEGSSSDESEEPDPAEASTESDKPEG